MKIGYKTLLIAAALTTTISVHAQVVAQPEANALAWRMRPFTGGVCPRQIAYLSREFPGDCTRAL
jgi:hypothetical protein